MSGRFRVLDKILIDVLADTKLSEMVLPEEQVLEKLNAVSTAKRLANMVRFVSILRLFNFLHGPIRFRACSTFGYPTRRPLFGVTPSHVTGFASSLSLSDTD